MKTIEQLIKEGSNPFQAEVIVDRSKELIVPAGAGSGKTKTLVTKMVELMMEGNELDQFLVLTFTKKAANEMKDRIKKMLLKGPHKELANRVDSAYVSTFDAYAYNFVKQHASKINLDSNLELLDSSVFQITKNEIMESLILSFMLHGTDEEKRFLNDFTEKKSSEKLISLLIQAHQSITNELMIDQIDENHLFKDLPLFDIDYLDNYLRDLDEAFYQDENNQLIIQSSFEYGRYLNGETSVEPQISEKKYNWKMFDESVKKLYTAKIKDVLDKFKHLKKLNVKKEDIDKVKTNKKSYAKVLLNILKKFDLKLQAFKKQANKYEFNDISNFLNKILVENESVRMRLKDQFKFIFVDEYQDTSHVQSVFLNMLIEDNDDIHVMYVGDIKQSIYKFRNAKPETFIQKQKEAKVISLNTNYRSHFKIIDFVNNIFLRILNDKDKYDINYLDNHEMLSGSTKFKDDLFPGVYLEEIYNHPDEKPDPAEEAFVVGTKILELKQSNKIKSFKEVAILARNTTHFKAFIDAFSYLGIPLQLQVNLNLNQTYLLKLMANILMLSKHLYNEDKSVQALKRFAYMSVARSELFKLRDYEIFEDLIETDISGLDRKKLHINPIIFEKLKVINELIYSQTNQTIVYQMLTQFSIYKHIAQTYDHDLKHFQIDYLINLCQPMSDLNIIGESFVEYFYKIAFGDGKLEMSILQESSEDSVKMTNIHQSKGLEYEVLFCVGLNKKFGITQIPQIKYSNDNLLELYPKMDLDPERHKLIEIDKIIKKNYQTIEKAMQLKEEIRLLYVAFTRAEKALYLVTTNEDDHSGLKSYANYLYEHDFTDLIPGDRKKRHTSFVTKPDFRDKLKEKQYYYPNEIDELSNISFDIESKVVEKVKASKDILTLLTDREKAAIKFGNEIHESFEFLNLTKDSNNPLFNKLRKTTFNQKSFSDAINIFNEFEFNYVENEIDKIGIIDLLVIYDDEVHIIDFKTRNIEDSGYVKQLASYRLYLSKIYSLPIKTYLYSITTSDVLEVKS